MRVNPTPAPKPITHTPEKVEAVKRRTKELDRVMPVTLRFPSHQYECLICGALVLDRNKHYSFHQGAMFHETLISLFGVPDES